MLGFIISVLYMLCSIPFILAGLRKMSWVVAIISSFLWVAFVTFGLYFCGVYIDSLLFSSVGLVAVFWKIFSVKWLLYAAVLVVSLLIIGISFWLLTKSVLDKKSYTGYTALKAISIACLVVIPLVMGMRLYGRWDEAIRFAHGGNFGIADPIFGLDVGFYVFKLPLLNSIAELLFLLLCITIFIFGIFYIYLYLRRDAYEVLIPGRTFDTRIMVAHLCGLGFLAVADLAWIRYLARFSYLFSTRGVVYGVGATDMFSIGANNWLIAFLVIFALVLLALAIRRRFSVLVASSAGAVVVVCWVVGLGLIPSLIQEYGVRPNELKKETEYLAYNIEFTRQAYDIDSWEEVVFDVKPITPEDMSENQVTFDNIRLWDWRALQDTYRQMQILRTYYEFPDIDIDRYVVDGSYRAVMLSVREIDAYRLPDKTWFNLHFMYTHGYGLALNTVNEFVMNEPKLLIKDTPPVSTVEELNVSRPEVYFGDLTRDYIFVGAGLNELDYPSGDDNVYCQYEGSGGVEMNSFLRRLCFAIYFSDAKILFSSETSSGSRVLWERTVKGRLGKLAPFLNKDADNYAVLRDDGSIDWIQDMYANTGWYPYSQPTWRNVNYIRNSVKAVVDGYDGTVDFYVFDDDDPIIEAYAKAFPDMFKPKSGMPGDLMKHIRYPEDMFTIQTNMFRTYHMKDVKVFYNKEDMWDIGREFFVNQEQNITPYYVIIRLPGEDSAEFLLMQSFTPKQKQNLIAWVAGRCDAENYGKVIVYKFSKQQLVYGPMQFEARVDQNDEMASQFTLWSRRSTVIRGNTLVIPIGDSIMYVSPVYLKSEEAKMPQLVRVIVGTQSIGGDLVVAWDSQFYGAVEKVIGYAPETTVKEPEEIEEAPAISIDELLQKLEDLNEEFNEFHEEWLQKWNDLMDELRQVAK